MLNFYLIESNKKITYEEARKDILIAVAKNDQKKIENALKKIDRVPTNERDDNEQKHLLELATSQKESLQKTDCMRL